MKTTGCHNSFNSNKRIWRKSWSYHQKLLFRGSLRLQMVIDCNFLMCFCRSVACGSKMYWLVFTAHGSEGARGILNPFAIGNKELVSNFLTSLQMALVNNIYYIYIYYAVCRSLRMPHIFRNNLPTAERVLKDIKGQPSNPIPTANESGEQWLWSLQLLSVSAALKLRLSMVSYNTVLGSCTKAGAGNLVCCYVCYL